MIISRDADILRKRLESRIEENGMKKTILSLCLMAFLWCILPGMQCNATEVGNPKIMLTNYSIDNNNIVLGEETKLHLEFTNMSKSYSLSEVQVTYTSENKTIMPVVGNTNQFYIPTMGKEETVSVDVPIVIYDIDNGYAQATFQMLYTVADTTQKTNTSYIVFPLESVGELSINNINVTKNIATYSKALIGVSYTNTGEEDIYNVVMNVSGDLDNGAQAVKLGNVKAGQNGYFEYYMSFSEAGTKSITVSFTYEDSEGKQYTVNESNYSIEVMDLYSNQAVTPQISDSQIQTATNNGIKISIPIILVAIALVLVICAGIIIMIVRKRGK